MQAIGWIAVVALLLGTLAAAVVCAIALDHAPPGEFVDPATGAWQAPLFRLFGLIVLEVAGAIGLASLAGFGFAWLIERARD